MRDTYFAPIQEQPDGGRYRSGAATAGPWAAELQHGGPPNALAVHTAERVAAAAGGGPYRAMRTAAEFLGPVPVADLEVRARALRQARSAVLVGVAVSVAGRDCLHAHVWLLREADTSAIAPDTQRPAVLPSAADAPGPGTWFPWGESVEWRPVSGAFRAPGPAAIWARPRPDLLPGVPARGLARAALVGDAASGVSSEVDWDEWSFINLDLDVHLARPLVGEWLLIDAATQLGPTGTALARSTLSDSSGPVGATAQTLLLAPRVP